MGDIVNDNIFSLTAEETSKFDPDKKSLFIAVEGKGQPSAFNLNYNVNDS